MWSRMVLLLGAGAVLAVGRAVVLPEVRLEVAVAPGQSLDDAILLDQGLRADWVRTDPVIRRRLVANLRFAGQEGTEAELLDRALGLGMARTDPVVRERLLQRANEALRQIVDPSEEDLQLHLVKHSARFWLPQIHVFQQLALGPDGAIRPIAALDEEQRVSTAQLQARFGADFARGVIALEPGESADLVSTYGRHRVFLMSRELPRAPTLGEVRPAVIQEVVEARRQSVAVRRMELLRAAYRVER